MTTALWMERIREVSPRFKARMAGGVYVFSVLTALLLELILGGRLGYAANIIQMSGMAAVTLLCYYIFKAVNKSLSLLAASFNFVGLTFEALRFNAHGVNIAIVFHGVICMLVGYLIFQVGLSASNSGRADGVCRFELADVSPHLADKLPIPLQSGLRSHWGGIGVPLAPRDGRKC